MRYYIYDLETLNNVFTFTGKYTDSDDINVFELSNRIDQKGELYRFLQTLKDEGTTMVGYNNIGFDYPIIHELMLNPHVFTYRTAKELCDRIIGGGDYGFTNLRFNERYILQLDLAKINHFDNKARRTSLKYLQFAMRSKSVEDLPFVNRDLTSEEIDTLRAYNLHDVLETEKFFHRCQDAIEIRKELSSVLMGDVMNFSDVKIGEQYLMQKIGRENCYRNGRPVQSLRSVIAFKDVILPKIKFRTEEFNEILDWFNSQSVRILADKTTTKIELKKNLAGVECKFALGGVHGSLEQKVFHSSDTHQIVDIDVAGMYVAVAVANGFAPEHLGEKFSENYNQIQVDRAKYPKGSPMNACLKLAGNGPYGKSNDPYSFLYDPKYTFTVTANGQLQLAQLLEVISLIPDTTIIQANTDGITLLLNRKYTDLFHYWKSWWETETHLKLEEVEYKSMFIRDVNNYIAVTTTGKVKRKGAYWFPEKDSDYDGSWHKNHSAYIVQKATSECLINGYTPEDIIYSSTDPFDFMLCHKTTGESKTMIGDVRVNKTFRYFISTTGKPMSIIRPCDPEMRGKYKRKNKITDEYYNQILAEVGAEWDERIHTKNKSIVDDTETAKHKGFLVSGCNNAEEFSWNDLNRNYYIEEVYKLLKGELNGTES